MKKFFKLIGIIYLLLSVNFSFAQKQWKFHIAFEDATGAKDTIWLIYDTLVTYGVDTIFGEGAIKLNHSKFNVYIGNTNADTTKTCALPYKNFPHQSADVRAINYKYPIHISWDTSLFHASYLPYKQGYFNIARIDNDYFFLENNNPPLEAYNMFLSDTVYAPYFNWGMHDQFPMNFTLSYDSHVGINDYINNKKITTIFPNPVNDKSVLTYQLPSRTSVNIKVYNYTGRELSTLINSTQEKGNNKINLNPNNYKAGMYFIKLETNNSLSTLKFIKE